MLRLLITPRAAVVSLLTVLTLAFGATAASAQLTPLSDFNYTGTSVGPIGIDSNPDGTVHAVWIAENGGALRSIVKVDSATLNPIFSIAPDGDPTANSGVLSPITGLAVDPLTRDVYVSDSLNHRVLLLDPSVGYATAQAPAPMTNCNNVSCTTPSAVDGHFNTPVGLDATATQVVVADSGNSRIQSFNTALVFGSKFTRTEWAGSTPIDVEVDSATGHAFVSLSGSNKVDEFDAAGAYVKTVGDGSSTPLGLATDAKTHLLYVAKANGIDVYSELSGDLVDTLTLPATVKDVAVNSVSKVLYVSQGAPTNKVKRYALGNPPTCSDTTSATLKNEPVSFALSCSDTAGSVGLKITAVSPPDSGSITLDSATGAVTYTPSHNYTGSETFTFRATTATGVSDVYTATVAVVPTAPIVHISANLGKSSGEIFIKVPGSDKFVPLTEDALVPLGTIVDASNGHCITTFANADKSLYAATFWGGVFEMGQGTGDNPPAVMKLRDDELSDAAAASAKTSVFSGGLAIAKKKKGKKKNKLWGDGKGNFTTTGGGGSASVRGTRWMAENHSNGTLFKVARGKVIVRDYWAHKSITLKIGDSYFAEKKPKKKKKKK